MTLYSTLHCYDRNRSCNLFSMALWSTQPLNRNKYQGYLLGGGDKGGRRVWLTTLPPSGADCLVILEASTS
jgi:hypothetical protein